MGESEKRQDKQDCRAIVDAGAGGWLSRGRSYALFEWTCVLIQAGFFVVNGLKQEADILGCRLNDWMHLGQPT